MPGEVTSSVGPCIFCDIVAGRAEASVVFEDEAALQTVFHFHLHVIPRYVGDGWTLSRAAVAERERSLLDGDAQAIKSAMASTR